MYQLSLQAKLVGSPLLTVALDLCDVTENVNSVTHSPS